MHDNNNESPSSNATPENCDAPDLEGRDDGRSSSMFAGSGSTGASPPIPQLDALIRLFSFDRASPLTLRHWLALMRATFIAHGLPDLASGTRPVHFVNGPPGAGKTTLAKIIGFVTTGRVPDPNGAPKQEDDFWVTVNGTTGVVVFDNVEDAPDYFPDAVARASTGGTHSKRKLYTDNELVVLRCNASMWLTTFSSPFVRADVLSRSLIFRLARPPKHIPEMVLLENVRADLPALRAEIDTVAGEVRRQFRVGPHEPPPGSGRMADFGVLGHVIANVIGGSEEAALFDAALVGMNAERLRLMNEGDPEVAAVITWARHPWNTRSLENGVAGLWITCSGILKTVAVTLGLPTQPSREDAQRLGRVLAKLKKSASGFIRIDTRIRGGHLQYRISLIEDLPLLTPEEADVPQVD